MRIPPYSTVMLPRLIPASQTTGDDCGTRSTGQQTEAGAARAASPANTRTPPKPRDVPVGPGGGRLLSHALCVTQIDLPAALGAHLHLGLADEQLAGALGFARALVAIGRHAGRKRDQRDPARGARLALVRVRALPEPVLIGELTDVLESTPWPDWVPPVAFAIPLACDIATRVDGSQPPAPPAGVRCPLLAARLIAAMRGPVFLRDAAPTLTNLLGPGNDARPSSGIYDLWLPVTPGSVRPLPPATTPTKGAPS